MRTLLLLLLLISLSLPVAAQRRAPRTATEYGVNLTYAIYAYEEGKSQTFAEENRLSTTFSTPQEEITFIRDRYGAEEMVLRHVRSIGLTREEGYTDVQRLGPDFMSISATAQQVGRSTTTIDFTVRYGKEIVLDKKGIKLENFETIMLKGKPGMFGLRSFVAPGGRNETATAMQTLLVTITAEMSSVEKLRNRPRDLSYPTDANGTALELKEQDKYIAPIVLSKTEPTLPAARPIAQTVVLQGLITPDGRVTNVRVVRSLESELDQMAIDAFRRYQFEAAKLNDQPVYAVWREEIGFRVPGQ